MIDGLRIGNMYLSSNLTNMSLSPLLFDQVDISALGPDRPRSGTNGVHHEYHPEVGRQPFRGSAARQRLRAVPSGQQRHATASRQRGLHGASTTLKKLYDINGAIGGPIKQDKRVVLLHVALLHE